MCGHPLLEGVVLPDLLIDGDAALRTLKACQAAQTGGLAAAGRAEQRGDAVAGQLKIDIERKVGALQLQAGLYEI